MSLQFDEIKAIGKQAREIYTEIANKTRAIAKQKLEQVEQFRIQQFVLLKQQTSNAKLFFQTLSTLLQTTKQVRKEMDTILENPIGIEQFRSLCDMVNAKVEQMEQQQIKVPWQIKFCCQADPDAKDVKIDFDGGRITDEEGNNIFGAVCYSCYEIIQDGAKGEGMVRYKNLDHANCNQCQQCYELKQLVRKKCPTYDGVDDAHWNETFAQITNIDSFSRFPILEAPTLSLGLHNVFKIYHDRPCFGTKDYQFVKYEYVHKRSLAVAAYLKNLLGNDRKPTVVGLCSSNRVEWMYTDFACAFNNYMTVGLHMSWPLDEVEFIINNAEICCVVCDASMAAKFAQVKPQCPILEYIVNMDSEEFISALVNDNIEEETLSGVKFSTPVTTQVINELDDTVPFALMYSSGTSGQPKGVICSRAGYKIDNLNYANFEIPNVMVSYSSLGHGMDRGIIWQTVANGGRVVFCPKEDELCSVCQVANPTILVAFPQFWNMIYAEYQQLQSKPEISVFAASKLGTRLAIIGTGGSPIANEVFSFLQQCFPNKAVINSYGLTEIPGISNNGHIRSGIDLKLRSVPSMGYMAPKQGEILVKSASMTTGYYKLPEQTKHLFDEDGYICTGDIGELDGEGKLHIIDRVTHFIEIDVIGRNVWIPGGELEAKLLECPLVQRIFLYGDRIESALIAVVIPYAPVSNDAEFTQQILSQFDAIVKKNNMPDYYAPKAILIEKNAQAWTKENGMLTVNGKQRRHKITKQYKQLLDLEYGKLSLANKK